MKSSYALATALAGAALALASPAAAQEGGGHRVSIGAGAQFYPKYPGADDLGLAPMPIFDFRDQGDPLTVEAPDEGWGFGLLGDDSAFDFGPAVAFQSKRDEDDVGAPVGKVGFTVEVGAFAQVFLGDHFRLRAEGRRGIGGHEGWVGDLGADLVLGDRENYVLTIGPRARWSNDDYQQAYFGVTPAVAATTGLAAYQPGSGFHAVGAVAGLTLMVSRNWGLYGYAGYDRLIDDAADSPIVRAYGSRNQYSAGLGLFYSFDIGRLF